MNEKSLMAMMPPYYQLSLVVSNISRVNARELDRVESRINQVFCQFFVDSADQALDRWEQQIGLEANRTLDLKQRRDRIKAKLRGRGTITKEMIAGMARDFSGGAVEITEEYAAGVIRIKFTGHKGEPDNLEWLAGAIREILPAHLAYEFEFTYNRYMDFERFTWGQLESLTWEQMEVVGIETIGAL